mmetsp:Transcript_57872/g.188131  ORF Transcript_57872/g.188131 Transcript_57872/m.188131 type:complete len:411 (+) Transcript_57872:1309-2541(+)
MSQWPLEAALANSVISSSNVIAPAVQPGVPLTTCCKARPKDRPTALARRRTSSDDSRRSISRASFCDLDSRASNRSSCETHCGTRSLQRAAKRSSKAVAAAGPQSVKAGNWSLPPTCACDVAAPMSTVRLNCGSNLLQSSNDAPGSRQTSRFAEFPTNLWRISSIFGFAPAAPVLSGKSTTSRFAHPMADNRNLSASTLSLWPNACPAACATLLSHASASGPFAGPKSSWPHRNSRATGCRIPGATSSAAAEFATACSPSNAATSSRRAAMPPSRTHSGKLSSKSRMPSTSAMASNWLRTSLRTQAMPSPLRRPPRFAPRAGCAAGCTATGVAPGVSGCGRVLGVAIPERTRTGEGAVPGVPGTADAAPAPRGVDGRASFVRCRLGWSGTKGRLSSTYSLFTFFPCNWGA